MLCESSSLEALVPCGQRFRQPGGLQAVHGEDVGRFQSAWSRSRTGDLRTLKLIRFS